MSYNSADPQPADRTDEERATIGEAKERLMAHWGCSEPRAYHTLRWLAQQMRTRLPNVARAFLDGKLSDQYLLAVTNKLKRHHLTGSKGSVGKDLHEAGT